MACALVVAVGVVVIVVIIDRHGRAPAVPRDTGPRDTGMAAMCPGPTYNMLGQLDGHDLVQIVGGPTRATSGALLLPTISLRENADQATMCGGSVKPSLVPRARLFPSGSGSDTTAPSREVSKSQDTVILAALAELGLKPGAPFTVTVIIGPDSGLAAALAIVDKIGRTELINGATVAATGSIDETGKVGPLGGIALKMIGARDAGATIFLVPADNCAEARASVPGGLRLIKVATLHDAVEALRQLHTSGTAPTC